MATKSENISEKLENLVINTENSNEPIKENTLVDGLDCDLPLDEVYKLALCFYKEKEGKAVHFSYEDKLQLVAFSQQVSHGPLSEVFHKLPVLGALDVVGKDRRLAWQKLGNLTTDQARSGFIELLSRRCPLFTTYIEAHRREKKERERRKKEDEKKRLVEEEEKLRKEQEEKVIQEQKEKEEAIRRQIQQALNAQTFDQFKQYAEQQFPGDPEKQGALIRQLQDQHYIQYMQQLQSVHQRPRINDENSNNNAEFNKTKTDWDNDTNESSQHLDNSVQPASMWTRQDIEAFKQAVSEAEGDGVVRVGHGETVTVRVPTHANATRLFWEFATDHYDIGFGIYFEYGTPTSSQVSVHVSESDDEDLDETEDEIYEDDTMPKDPERGPVCSEINASKPLLTEIVPVYRRDCHNEVYAGSHQYPGVGVYLLKFDNSYSVWRSKTLYYRVYYTQ
ncbi:Golgi resident protein GCP60 [Coccinella septempunctata]|uniref:Golgi resident protein GCP60 n=1 Tax=Coccinella septempunctata TaxID=41139 RepID=UPI001D074FED|nr:Golgi resident protein GCP60 [Coccinella septempunctata]